MTLIFTCFLYFNIFININIFLWLGLNLSEEEKSTVAYNIHNNVLARQIIDKKSGAPALFLRDKNKEDNKLGEKIDLGVVVPQTLVTTYTTRDTYPTVTTCNTHTLMEKLPVLILSSAHLTK